MLVAHWAGRTDNSSPCMQPLPGYRTHPSSPGSSVLLAQAAVCSIIVTPARAQMLSRSLGHL